jgi:hypothetical protein
MINPSEPAFDIDKQSWNRKPHPYLEVANWQELESLIVFE